MLRFGQKIPQIGYGIFLLLVGFDIGESQAEI
jgi:hypothetical protein